MIPKLLLFDLDFTLLGTNRKISERTLKALKTAQKKGSLIGFATSRGNTNLENLVELVNPDVVITNGGGSIYLKNQLIHTETFTLEETKALLSKAFEVLGPEAEITIDTVDNLYWNRKDNKSECYAPDATYNDMHDFPEPAMKICIQTTDTEKANLIASSIKACDILRFSDIPWHKFSNPYATKGNGLRYLASHLGIPIQQTAAFGDDFPDLSMLQAAGIGIAMKNAPLAVQQAADEVTASCDEDGVAVWLEQHL